MLFKADESAYQVQYPAGTSFSNVTMTVTAVQITQAQFQRKRPVVTVWTSA
jgi:hypothetical protein